MMNLQLRLRFTSALLFVALIMQVTSQKGTLHPQFPTEPKSCCYGDGRLQHGDVIFSHAPHCFQLICLNGFIQQQYVQKKGDMDCCEFNHLLYPNGTTLAGHCMEMKCKSGTWIPVGKIEDCCNHCYIYNDPHITTFDGHPYDWHGTCNYSLAQWGASTDPDLGVFGKFQNCQLASCLSYTTFRNDPHSVVTIFDREVLKLNVNGDEFNVTETVQHLRSGSGKHPVLTWKYGNCTFLMGTSKLLILHCRDRLDIWAHPVHVGKLNGLCGLYNQHITDDFTKRDGTIQTPLTYWPLAFPQSWLTLNQSDTTCSSPCPTCKGDTTTDPCKTNQTDRAKYTERCRAALLHLENVDGFKRYLDTCAFDLCMLYQAGSNEDQITKWLGQVEALISAVKDLAKKS